MSRQFLDEAADVAAATIVARLCGVQAQVARCAEQTLAIRQANPRPGQVDQALTDRTIIKTWAMRGTLHLLSADSAAAYLSLMAAARTWEQGTWQRAFATAGQVTAITHAAGQALASAVLTRDELIAEIVRHTNDTSLSDQLRSGWGALLKPVAWQGYLINGPSDGSLVTFTSPRTWVPGWRGLPEPEEAARLVIPAYLGAFGPASMKTFDQWLTRGASPKTSLRNWFMSLLSEGELAQVEVDGEPSFVRVQDAEEIAGTEPSRAVRLLPAFDQYVLGPGTMNAQIVSTARRHEISRAAGWITPVVLVGGRVSGTWDVSDHMLDVRLFAEVGKVPATAIEEEAERLAAFLGFSLTVSTRIT